MKMNIIDGRVRLRTPLLGSFWDSAQNPDVKEYETKYNYAERKPAMETDELISIAASAGVQKLLVYGSSPEENSQILDLSRLHKQLIPVGGVNLKGGIQSALQEIGRLKAAGIAAIDFSFLDVANVNDRKFYALYAYCELHQIPVIIHSAIHYARSNYMWRAKPEYFDEIAVDFPQLKIIMSHGGNGFGPPVLAVTQRHPNIFLEFSAMRPKYMAPEFIQAANTYLKHHCIFGTDYPLTDFEPQINLWKYALREEVWEHFFEKNLLRALFEAPVS